MVEVWWGSKFPVTHTMIVLVVKPLKNLVRTGNSVGIGKNSGGNNFSVFVVYKN